ncbi:MAG: UxaA family hydrolase, partial [Phaeodactylibacter sp.]|nr:UxaA family hydrolase [Phaeodactylibacter sp.]
LYQSGAGAEAILEADIIRDAEEIQRNRLFPNVDGIKFLQHDGGCGGIRQDSETLCRLLAGYITHSNVAGATILSLGCQNAQFQLLEDALQALAPNFSKPLYILEQQKSNSERDFIAEAVKKTFTGLMEANKTERRPAPLSKLTLGLECGGSDGFSGISANPALGYTSDLLVALGGTAILSEFPELNGVEQELINRCMSDAIAGKFASIMQAYAQRAVDVGSGFDMNPSPGNIKDGLITDAMKSAGAAKKGGTSPVVDVLDYTEQAAKPGLNLLCTPGNDVESTTGLAGSGANLIVFTTGLGTPTGNPIAPTIKMASNTVLANRMPDLIDVDAGTIISGEDTIETKGEELLEYLIRVASGEATPNAVRLGQDDFIPWKRGISL